VSMSRKGDCWDNAPMESVNGTLKVECVNDAHFETREQAGSVRISVCEARETCPRRRSSLATNDRRGGQVGAAYYAAAFVKRSA
jgi:transposase InsO family protein